MTPEKLLDYSVKFGLLPLAFLVIMWTRADLKETQKDVKELQILLIDCYQDKAISRPLGLTKVFDIGFRFFAIIPDNPIGKIKRYV